jgi:hypothetical protein
VVLPARSWSTRWQFSNLHILGRLHGVKLLVSKPAFLQFRGYWAGLAIDAKTRNGTSGDRTGNHERLGIHEREVNPRNGPRTAGFLGHTH